MNRARAFAALFLLFALLLGGCKKVRTPDAAEIHAITREFVATLKGGASTDVRTDFNASDRDPASSDFIRATVRADSESSARATIFGLLRSISTVATRNHLIQEGPLESRSGLLYAYRRGGRVTHRVLCQEQVPAAHGVAPEQGSGAPLAIILDDLGNDRAAAEAIFELGYPVTLSVLPNHPHSTEIAEEAHRRGYQVMLHLPMQSVANEQPEAQELRPGMTAGDVNTIVGNSLRAVPDVVGVNNHQGSQSTADAALMNALMPVLRQHNLFYVDSRTTAATLAYDTAQRLGVRSGYRNVPFLDDVAELGLVRKQLQQALRDTQKKGYGIAIGHPHPSTLQALREIPAEAKAHGVRLVFVSELVH